MRQMSNEYRADRVFNGFASEREFRNYRWKIRRQREIRNRIMKSVITLCLIICLAVSYHSIISHAENEIENVYLKYYTEIEVKYGDSLWTIAEQYADSHYSSNNAYIREVKSINHLSGDVVMEGQTLIIPYYSSEYK